MFLKTTVFKKRKTIVFENDRFFLKRKLSFLKMTVLGNYFFKTTIELLKTIVSFFLRRIQNETIVFQKSGTDPPLFAGNSALFVQLVHFNQFETFVGRDLQRLNSKNEYFLIFNSFNHQSSTSSSIYQISSCKC